MIPGTCRRQLHTKKHLPFLVVVPRIFSWALPALCLSLTFCSALSLAAKSLLRAQQKAEVGYGFQRGLDCFTIFGGTFFLIVPSMTPLVSAIPASLFASHTRLVVVVDFLRGGMPVFLWHWHSCECLDHRIDFQGLIALFLVKPIAIHDWELIGWQLGKAKLLPALWEQNSEITWMPSHIIQLASLSINYKWIGTKITIFSNIYCRDILGASRNTPTSNTHPRYCSSAAHYRFFCMIVPRHYRDTTATLPR